MLYNKLASYVARAACIGCDFNQHELFTESTTMKILFEVLKTFKRYESKYKDDYYIYNYDEIVFSTKCSDDSTALKITMNRDYKNCYSNNLADCKNFADQLKENLSGLHGKEKYITDDVVARILLYTIDAFEFMVGDQEIRLIDEDNPEEVISIKYAFEGLFVKIDEPTEDDMNSLAIRNVANGIRNGSENSLSCMEESYCINEIINVIGTLCNYLRTQGERKVKAGYYTICVYMFYQHKYVVRIEKSKSSYPSSIYKNEHDYSGETIDTVIDNLYKYGKYGDSCTLIFDDAYKTLTFMDGSAEDNKGEIVWASQK